MARQPARSQRPSQASQSQPPRGTQGGRARRTRAEDHEEEEQENAYEDGGDEDIPADKAQQDIERKARDLVRLALFHEQRRIPLKRDEISKKGSLHALSASSGRMLGSNSRSFNMVFAAANDILKRTFGMELVELHSTSQDADISQKDAEMLKNAGVKKKAPTRRLTVRTAASTGTKSYILRSLLDPSLIQRATAPDPDIRELEQVEFPDENEEFAEDDNPVGTRSTGSIVAWHSSDQLASVGILYVILALILVEGRSINDNDLHAILKRLQLPANASIPLSSQSTNQNLTLDAYLSQLTRQGYLEKVRLGNARGPQNAPARHNTERKPRRGRTTTACLPPTSGAGAASSGGSGRTCVHGRAPREDDGDEDAVSAPDDEATQKRVQLVFRGVERAAAGAPLADVR
ncbi:MAGE family-domain-containing protein [Cubamyces lactineus]|nr:MAGE family-domain-containing protein [Cubamyces lactineus]